MRMTAPIRRALAIFSRLKATLARTSSRSFPCPESGPPLRHYERDQPLLGATATES